MRLVRVAWRSWRNTESGQQAVSFLENAIVKLQGARAVQDATMSAKIG